MFCSKHYATVVLLGITMISGHEVLAQSATLIPFDQFVQQVATTPLATEMSKPGTQVSDAPSFEAMRSHVLTMYNGVQVKHSFLLDTHPFDCVPMMQQPSVRLQHLTTIATPPSVGPAFPAAKGSSAAAAIPSQVDAAQPTDPLGNTIGCDSGSIPMRRVTLDDLSEFKSLSAFFQKGPDGAGQYQSPDNAAPAVATHIIRAFLSIRVEPRRHRRSWAVEPKDQYVAQRDIFPESVLVRQYLRPGPNLGRRRAKLPAKIQHDQQCLIYILDIGRLQ